MNSPMNTKDTAKSLLKQTIESIRAEQPNAELVRDAEARLWAQGREPASSGAIHGCADVRSLLEDYRNKKLAVPRALLVEAHLHECSSCSRYFERAANLEAWKAARPLAETNPLPWKILATAAALLVVAGLATVFIQGLMAPPPGPRATVASIEGGLYRVSVSGEQAVRPGDQFGEGEIIRTPSGGHAFLQLTDGSRVEMNERAEFSVSQGRKDTTLHLERGNIIVHAAKRTTGHLYVDSRDCRVAVTGTIFSVSSGIRDSRVAVIEGAVLVSYSGEEKMLHPGDGLSTAGGTEPVSVQQEIAWSRNLDQYLKLLTQIASLQKKLASIQMPGLRYDSRLLRFVPQNAVLFASSPNYGDALMQANQLLHDQLQTSDTLKQWWDQINSSGHPTLEEMIQKFETLSQYLGDEAVFTIVPRGERSQVLILAEVRRAGLREYLEHESAEASTQGSGHPTLQVLDAAQLGSLQSETANDKVFAVVLPEHVAFSSDPLLLKNTVTRIESQTETGFAQTAYGQMLVNLYSRGAGLLFTADVENFDRYQIQHPYHGRSRSPEEHRADLDRSGFGDVKYVIAERKDVNGATENHAWVIFKAPRHAIASWLAAPAPMGGLEFVSPQASAVGSMVVKKPEAMFDDAFSIAAEKDSKVESELVDVESRLRVRLREDLAASLGGEVTFALDGPLLPNPSWKVIAEVNDSGRLQNALRTLVEDCNAEAARENKPGLSYEESQFDGRTYYHVQSQDATPGKNVYYTFADGYMIIGPERAILVQAIATRQSGRSIVRSAQFLSTLPQSPESNVSALYYQNLAPLMESVSGQLTPSQLQSVRDLIADSKPSMVVAYGEESQIEFVTNTRFPGLDLNSFALTRLLALSNQGTGNRRTPY